MSRSFRDWLSQHIHSLLCPPPGHSVCGRWRLWQLPSTHATLRFTRHFPESTWRPLSNQHNQETTKFPEDIFLVAPSGSDGPHHPRPHGNRITLGKQRSALGRGSLTKQPLTDWSSLKQGRLLASQALASCILLTVGADIATPVTNYRARWQT